MEGSQRLGKGLPSELRELMESYAQKKGGGLPADLLSTGTLQNDALQGIRRSLPCETVREEAGSSLKIKAGPLRGRLLAWLKGLSRAQAFQLFIS